MDAIGKIFTSIPGVGGGGNPIWQTLLKLGTAGAGSIGNILASMKRNDVLNTSLNNQKNLMALANNPNALATNISKLERPLSAGLTSSVGNAVQGYLAERGLSESPGIASETLAQGLAPYQQQEQQMAINSYLSTLGLPAQATPRFLPYPQGTDLSKIFQSLFAKPDALTAGGGIADSPTMQQLTANLRDSNAGQTGTLPNSPAYTGDNGSNFDWMDLLNNYGGMTAAPSF